MDNKAYIGIGVGVVVLLILGFMFFGGDKVSNGKEANEIEAANYDREIEIISKRYEFVPSEIRIKKGEIVKIVVKADDVPHGFAVPELGIDIYAEPFSDGVYILDTTNLNPGTYQARCSVYCGEGHSRMLATLIIE